VELENYDQGKKRHGLEELLQFFSRHTPLNVPIMLEQ